MSKKRKVFLSQVNYRYGNNVFVPYSVGMLIAYAQSQPDIASAFEFSSPHFLREDPGEVVRKMDDPSVVGLSCYLWNMEYNMALGRLVKEAFPKCLLVLGGTHVPNRPEGFFFRYPFVDILVHQEGEITFAEILRASLSGTSGYSRIPGLTVQIEGGSSFTTRGSERIRDLSQLPSPYLMGVFDGMLEGDWTLNASQETDRGCPYGCTFCDWGGINFNKVMSFPEERICAELEWFGRNKVSYIFNCNANYGILPRDLELTRKMIEIRAKYGGYPEKFRMCTAKNSNDKIFTITKMLSDAGMNKGATLSFQSMDDNTLEIVKRKNIKIADFSSLMNRYKQAGIATYTELILGMPGETYESTKQGIDTLLDAQAESVNIYVYPCTMLPNSEMSHPEYVKRHGIESVRMPVLLAHSTPDPDSISEYTDVVVATSAMSRDSWVESFMFYIGVQAFHCLGLTTQIALFFRRYAGIPYSYFYEQLVRHLVKQAGGFAPRELRTTRHLIESSLRGGRLDRILPEWGEIYWPLEEAVYLQCIGNIDYFYEKEIQGFLQSKFGNLADSELLSDLVKYQRALVMDPYFAKKDARLSYDLHAYFAREDSGRQAPGRTDNLVRSHATRNFDHKIKDFAREVVWYGRKGGKFQHTNITVEYL